MFRNSLPKLVLVLVLSTLLAAPTAGWSAGRRFPGGDAGARSSAPESPLALFWSYLSGLWEKTGGTENGCGLDAHGGCPAGTDANGSASPNTDAGCGIDPHGGCATGG